MAGEVDTSVDQLLSLKPSSQLPLVNPRKKGKQPRYKVLNFDDMCFNEHIKDSGKLIVHFCYLDLQPSFLDFVQVRITFTFHFHFSTLLFNTFTFKFYFSIRLLFNFTFTSTLTFSFDFYFHFYVCFHFPPFTFHSSL